MKTDKFKPISLALAIFLITTPAVYAMPFAESEGEGGGHHGNSENKRHEKMQKIFEEIGLSEEQLQQIKEHRKNQMEGMKESHAQLREKHEALRTALDSAESDRNQIDVLVTDISSRMTQQIRHRVDSVLTLKEILTPDQFAQLRAKTNEFREQHQQNRRRGPGSMMHGRNES